MDMRHDATAKPWRTILWRARAASLLVVAALACSCQAGENKGKDEPATDNAATEVTLDPAHGAVQLMRIRIDEIASVGLPAAMEADDPSTAQKLCNSARARATYVETHFPEQADDIRSSFERLERVCSHDLVVKMLDDLISRLRASNEDDLHTNCIAGSVLMAFAFEHRSDDDEVVGRRKAAFELCPNLQKEWDISTSGKVPDAPPEPPILPRTRRPTDADVTTPPTTDDAVDAPPAPTE